MSASTAPAPTGSAPTGLDEVTEAALAARIATGRAAAEQLAHHPTDPALQSLVRDAARARDEFIAANQRLVISLARRYEHRGLPLEDLIQEGNVGITRAVDRFDPTLGYRFSTYATWWIRQALRLALSDIRAVRLPDEVEEGLRKIHAVEQALAAALGRTPSLDEIAARASLPPAEITRLLTLESTETSLDLPTGEDSHTVLGDLVADAHAEGAYQQVEQARDAQALRATLAAVLPLLSTDQEQVLRLRFGLTGEAPLTLEQAAAHLGCDRLQVRRLEAAALACLRAPEARRSLLDHL